MKKLDSMALVRRMTVHYGSSTAFERQTKGTMKVFADVGIGGSGGWNNLTCRFIIDALPFGEGNDCEYIVVLGNKVFTWFVVVL